MHKSIKDIISLNQQLEKEIPAVLSETIIELKKLIENESIISFSFRKNDIYLAQEKPVYASISTVDFDDIRLGLLGSMSEWEKIKKAKLPKELKKTLDNLNANLFVLNEHFPKKMPIVKNNSYFSLMAINKEGGFANDTFDFLPEFIFEPTSMPSIKKNKLK